MLEENFINIGIGDHPVQALNAEARGRLDRNRLGRDGFPYHAEDTGRQEITGNPDHAFKFRSLTLRQLRDGGNFMHNASFTKVRDVVEYFNAGVAQDPTAGAAHTLDKRFTNPRGPGYPAGLGLSRRQVDDLTDFLENGLYDPAFRDDDPKSTTDRFQPSKRDLTYSKFRPDLAALGAKDGFMPSGLAINNNDPVMKDVRVRKALSMVIDRDILAKKVTADGQVPAYGVVVKGIFGADVTAYDWSTWPMDKRVAEAKKLLAEAGIKPGTKIKFTYNTSEYHKKMAIFTASEWKTKLGLDTEMDNLEFKVLLKKRHDGDYQIARHGWVADYNDVTTFLTLVQCDSDSNDNKNCNRKAQALIDQGNQSMDPAKRKALLTEAAKMIMDDYPMIPLVQYTLPRLVKSYVGGYDEANPMDHFRSKDFYIIKH